mmetsp:Transcript_38943/g.39645  ORF Transcript_38943/g.39645 Transcript_38943/m.39645 type:complete len:249 (+) Transcript_38943:199-945(+)
MSAEFIIDQKAVDNINYQLEDLRLDITHRFSVTEFTSPSVHDKFLTTCRILLDRLRIFDDKILPISSSQSTFIEIYEAIKHRQPPIIITESSPLLPSTQYRLLSFLLTHLQGERLRAIALHRTNNNEKRDRQLAVREGGEGGKGGERRSRRQELLVMLGRVQHIDAGGYLRQNERGDIQGHKALLQTVLQQLKQEREREKDGGDSVRCERDLLLEERECVCVRENVLMSSNKIILWILFKRDSGSVRY